MSKNSSRRRNRMQKDRATRSKAREEAQLVGALETLPAGAVRCNEVVPPSAQSTPPMPELIARAARQGWATPEEKKPMLVDELISVLDNPEMPAKIKVAAFNALRQADQAQYERDHPKGVEAKSGSPVELNVNVINVTERETVRFVVEGNL